MFHIVLSLFFFLNHSDWSFVAQAIAIWTMAARLDLTQNSGQILVLAVLGHQIWVTKWLG